MVRVGLIGNGKISGTHKKAYAQLEDVSLEVYCDSNPNNLKDLTGVRVYTDYVQMLEQEQGKLDYVDICLPTFLHAEVAVKAMEMGFHVLCEKPMARNMQEAQEMIDTSRRTGKKLMIAHCNRFWRAVEEIRRTILSGELGRVRSAEFSREGNAYMGTDGVSPWFFDGSLSGGGMLDTHVHDVDLIRWLFGMPRAVSTGAAAVYTKGGYDALSTNYYYDDGLFVRASSDWTIACDKFNTRQIRVNFEKGYMITDRSPGREVFVKVREDGTVTDLIHLHEKGFYYNEIVYFIDCILNDKPVEQCPPEESADAVKIVLAEIKSADEQGKLIALDEV